VPTPHFDPAEIVLSIAVEQAQSQVLPTQVRGKAQIADRDRKMEPDGGRHCGNLGHNAGESMTLWSRLRSWMRATLLRSRMESEMDTELRFHLRSVCRRLDSQRCSSPGSHAPRTPRIRRRRTHQRRAPVRRVALPLLKLCSKTCATACVRCCVLRVLRQLQ